MKKIVAFVLAALMAAAMVGTASAKGNVNVDEQNSDYVEYVGSGEKSGVVPAPMELAPIASKKLFRSSALPAKYDLREKRLVTSVKDQKRSNSCWTFASIGSLESHLLTMKKGTKDFSELHMEYMASKYSKGGGKFTDGKTNPEGYNRNVDDGGNSYMAVAYAMRDKGVVAEGQLTFTDNLRPLSLSALQNKTSASIWLKDFEFLPQYSSANKVQLRDAMKSRIMQYGALDASMYLDSQTVNNTSLYKKSSNRLANHAVVIVGWDDNYAKNKFRPDTPSTNGAWIVKNSYGTGNYDKGYMYVSYDELPTYQMVSVARKTGSKSDYSRMYSFDPLGANLLLSGKSTIYAVNRFSGAKSGEQLSAVTFFSGAPATYEIYVSSDGKQSDVSKMTKVASGNMDYIGYKTADISKPLKVSSNFAVVVKLTSSSGAAIGVEGNDGGVWSTATAKAGESLASYDGKDWGQITTMGSRPANASIKAFTKTTSSPVNPTTPTGLKATSNTSNRIALTWNAIPGINRYGIYRSKSKDTGYTYLTSVSTNSYVNTGLKAGDTYYYKVLSSVPIAGGKFKNSSLSAPVSATVKKSNSPANWAVPSGLRASGITGKKVTLNFNKVSGAQRYAVYWSYWKDGPYRYGLWKGDVKSATYYGMMPNRNYYFKVIAGKYIGGKWVYNSLDDCQPVYVKSKSA